MTGQEFGDQLFDWLAFLVGFLGALVIAGAIAHFAQFYMRVRSMRDSELEPPNYDAEARREARREERYERDFELGKGRSKMRIAAHRPSDDYTDAQLQTVGRLLANLASAGNRYRFEVLRDESFAVIRVTDPHQDVFDEFTIRVDAYGFTQGGSP